MAEPWYDFPRIDNFGTIDPEGNYWKPDSNIQLPGLYPVTAVLSGVITAVQRTGYGQEMVTEKLNTPLDSLATHMFFEHMNDATVSVGQTITPGMLIGHNNPAGQVPLGVGLYSGDVYGSGPAWGVLQADLAPGGAGELNPVNILNKLKAGQSIDPCAGLSGQTLIDCMKSSRTSSGVGADAQGGILPDITPITNFFTYLEGLDFKDIAVRVALVVGAILIITIAIGHVM